MTRIAKAFAMMRERPHGRAPLSRRILSLLTPTLSLLLSLSVLPASADVKSLVQDGRISWDEGPEEFYLNADGTTASKDSYEHLVLKYTDVSITNRLVIGDGIKAEAQILLVGGGGAGGSATGSNKKAGAGGGGGAGGMVERTVKLEGGTIDVIVGVGGIGKSASPGGNGESSIIKTNGVIIAMAYGGGGGGAASAGASGGSGGGGSQKYANKTATPYDGGAGEPGQGNAGGTGNTGYSAAGGGGAGSAGADSSEDSNVGGKGGDGLSSAILPDENGNAIYYAGGGGGGTRNQSVESSLGTGGAGGGGTGGGSSNADSGTDGLGGGGGGSQLGGVGGNGGSGVVIVRITFATESEVAVPSIENIVFTGENIVGFDPGFAYVVVGGDTNATNVGKYSFEVKPADDFTWLDGSTVATNVDWSIVPRAIPMPEVASGLVYDGTIQDGALYDSDEHDLYCDISEESVISEANAGTYSFTVSLIDTVNTVWADGTTDAITKSWSISALAVAKPSAVQDLVYEGTNAVVFTAYDGVVYVSGDTNSVNAGSFYYTVALDNPAGYTNYVWAGATGDASVANVTVDWEIAPKSVDVPVPEGLVYNDTAQNGFAALDWTLYELASGTTNETSGGSYKAVFHLTGNGEADNYVWSTDPATGSDQTVPWSIGQAANEITTLELTGWRIGGETNAPVIAATWGVEKVEYSYGFGESVDDVDTWVTSTDDITKAGPWVLRAVIPETLNWAAATGTTTFVMWDDPAQIFRNWTAIEVKGTTNALADFIVPVRISEERMPGFYYDAANTDELVFLADGALLSYDVDTWNTNGESVVWLKIPTLPTEGITVTMYWNLRDGQIAPENTPTDVWSDYVGVWHMSETNKVSGSNLGAVTVKDASGHQDGTGHRSSSVADGIFGNARGRTETGAKGYAATVPEYPELDALSDSAFTISGWINLRSTTTAWGYLFARKDNDDYNGWAAQFRGSNGSTGNNDGISFFTSGGGNRYTFNTTGKFTTTGVWTKYDFVRSGTTLSFYLNGVLVNTVSNINPVVSGDQPFTIGGMNVESSDTGKKASTLNGYSDEVRLMPAAMSAEQIAAEYKYQSDSTMSTNGIVYLDGLKVDYWVEEPAMDKTTWDVKDTAGVFTNTGILGYGTVTNWIYSVYDESEVYDRPSAITNAGSYRAVFTQVDTNGFHRIEKTFDIRVTASKPYYDIVGNGGDSGRVLLMNNHTAKSGIVNVDYQGWYDADNTDAGCAGSAATPTYWHHMNLIEPEVKVVKFNLKNGTESALYALGGVRLWHILDCRHGNTFPNDMTSNLDPTQNYLSWDQSYSRSINDHTINKRTGLQTAANRMTVGQVVMRNTSYDDTDDAPAGPAVYSPCYTNGIGTIYFDAVNGWTGVTDYYNIVVEYATNTVDGLEPTDANCISLVTNYTDETTFTVSTNWYGKLDSTCWTKATMRPFIRDLTLYTGGNFVETNSTDVLSLQIEHGGTADNFYRVVVPLDVKTPVRFRIRRVTSVPSSIYTIDEAGFILLDNIIASVPAMGAALASPGRFDETKTGKRQLGWELATSVPYPSVNDDAIFGYAMPSYYVNSGDGKSWNTNDFFLSAKMHYRWRYLNQLFSDWSEVELNPSDGFHALAAFDLPGHACDVEYWYEYHLQAPYYSYVDYSGVGKSIGYTEERGTLTNALASTTLPSCGTNWFFRVRDGKSAYSGIDIVYIRDGETAEERSHMSLVGNNSWRGFIQTREGQTGAVKYRFEALDEQTAEYAAYAPSTNHWYCSASTPTLPVSDAVVDGATNAWGVVTNDAVTGYIMVQLDESTKALTIVHADYQNFNEWTDALNREGSDGTAPIFVGTSATNEYKIGTSPKKQTFKEDFSLWGNMPAVNDYWQIPTYPDINHLYGGTAYEHFDSETNSIWSIGPGMWVSKRYRVATDGSGVGIQMDGSGKGYMQFIEEAYAPRGIETISFNARLGHSVDFDDFNYYDGEVKTRMKNYTFMTRAAFDLNSNKNFSGNASLSLVADYRPGRGCYEARWEWIAEESGNKGGQRLCLYRWNADAEGTMGSTLLTAWTNGNTFAQVKTTAFDDKATFMPFYIAVSNDTANACTWVSAGVRSNGITLQANPWKDSASGTKDWYIVACRDTNASRLTSGTFGVLAANCEGVFGKPQYTAQVDLTDVSGLKPGQAGYYTQKERSFETTLSELSMRTEGFGTDDTDWVIYNGRMATTNVSTHVTGIVSAPVPQTISIYLGDAGKANWGTAVTNISVSGFGGSRYTVPFYTTDDCSVRFEVGAVKTAVVMDSIEIRQWRGGEWDDDSAINGVTGYLPSWADSAHRNLVSGYSNFVFTSAWTTNNMVLLGAKRANLGMPSAIRSPLMDGYVRDGSGQDGTSRGYGLGMVSFGYRDAQENAVLSIQIATNLVSTSTIKGYDATFNEKYWTPVTNIDFSAMSETERKSGTISHYIGLHSVTGVVRVAVATQAIASVASVTDPKKFGEVFITDIVVRDEPAVDAHSWWGWNMRTIGGDDDSEGRMLLDDFSIVAGDMGLSGALNNSVTDMIDVSDAASYKQHKPFIQTPTFAADVVGEVTFKARKYSSSDPTAAIVIFGSKDVAATSDGTWTPLAGATFYVTNSVYESFTYQTDPGQNYRAFRLAVAGVEGVTEGYNGLPDGIDEAQRVLLDEVFVSEAIRARMGFLNVGCFRGDMKYGSSLSSTTEIAKVPSEVMQPLCNESWGVQCEIYGAQLADQIDFKTYPPLVKLHWYEGDSPWGYENWKSLPGARSAWLSRAKGTDEDRYVYRSSMRESPDAIISMSTRAPSYVQYMLEVVYHTVGSSVPTTNWLTSADWKTPSWYRPRDLNAEFGANGDFAAYNILDTVAPGWAWINEVNILGVMTKSFKNTEAGYQFVEIAHPPEADITGWTVRLLEPQVENGLILTNVLATFGPGGPSGTKALAAEDSDVNMVFRVLANKAARTSGRLSEAAGTLDAVWMVENPTQVFTSEGEIGFYDPVGFQLVRQSGVIEHEIVVEGTNFLETVGISNPRENYIHSRRDFLKSNMASPETSRMIIPGYDIGGELKTLSVIRNFGHNGMEEETNDWTYAVSDTPGHKNVGQVIDPDHPVPAGEELLVYFSVTGDHIEQSLNGVDYTNGVFSAVVSKGSVKGTNVFYRTDNWYVLGEATTNGVSIMDLSSRVTDAMPYVFELDGVAKATSNNVTVIASAAVDPRLAEYGVGADDPYREAVIDWLMKGVDLNGNAWHDTASGDIKLAEFWTLNNTFQTNLTLREMYWLDMDPTVGDLALVGGLAIENPPEHLVTWTAESGATLSLTNRRVRAYMMITNTTDDASSERYGEHWTPYALRGLEPGSSSLGYDQENGNWTSVTFKATGMLLNTYTSATNIDNRVPLRQFVFDRGSFASDGWSKIEITDPYSPLSLGYQAGWKRWWDEHGVCPIFYYWSLDTRLPRLGVEVLKEENY